MTHVSSKKVDPKVLKRINKLLMQQLARVRTVPNAHVFLEEFFSSTEQLMLAKRFAVIIMLEQGYGYKDIYEALGVSSSTVSRLWRKKKEGAYDGVLEQCFPRRGRGVKAGKELELTLETLLRGGMPPMGRGRWRSLYKRTARNYSR